MSELNKITSTIINVSNNISVKELSTKDINELSQLVLWDISTPDNKPITFGGNYFRQSSTEKGLVIDTGSLLFDYELKSIMVAALHLGIVEGGTPYKWKSVVTRIRTLQKLSSFLQIRSYNSFRELNKLEELKLRNLISDFLCDTKSNGGMEQGKYTSAAKTVREALTFLHVYGLVDRSLLAPLVDELTISKIIKHEEEHRLKHSIIPTAVMKAVIESSTNYVNNAKANLPSFIDINTRANNRIELSNAGDPRQALITANWKLLPDISRLYAVVRDLNLHVYTLVLAFTGMRDNEAYALKNNCHSRRVETGETVVTVRSQLSKTTEGTIELDWV